MIGCFDVYYPDGSFENYGYDQAGELTSVSDWGPAPPMQASPELRSESFGYDADGNQTSATDWDGHTTAYSYNAAGELTSEVKPVSSSSSITTSYGYDPAGNPTSVTDGNTNTTWTTFNAWNLPESVIEPATPAAPDAADRTWTTAYNADRLPATASEPGGISLSYGYDPLGDLTSESGTGASAATEARSFAYDLDGQLTSALHCGRGRLPHLLREREPEDNDGPVGRIVLRLQRRRPRLLGDGRGRDDVLHL